MTLPQKTPAAVITPRDDARARAFAAGRLGLWHWDHTTGSASFDPEWCRDLRIDSTPECWTPGGWHRNVHPDDLPDLRKRLEALVAGDSGLFEAEYRLLTGDYRWVWILQRGGVVRRDAQGRALEMTGICLDIDERKGAEVVQRDNESRLATALWGARAAFWSWHVPTNTGTRSALWFAMTGYSREEWEAVPMPFISRLHPTDRDMVQAAAREHCAGRTESMETEYRIRTKQGEWKWMLGRGRAVEWDLEGKPTLIIGVSLDIDAQKRAEQQLLQGEARLNERCLLAAEAACGIIYESDPATRRVEWIGVERFLGYAPGELPVSTAAWLELVHPEDRALVARPIDAAQESVRRTLGLPYRVRHRAGHYLHVREHVMLVRDEQGNPLRRVGVTIDVSQQEAMARRLEDLALAWRRVVSVLPVEGSPTRGDAEAALECLEAAIDAARGPSRAY